MTFIGNTTRQRETTKRPSYTENTVFKHPNKSPPPLQTEAVSIILILTLKMRASKTIRTYLLLILCVANSCFVIADPVEALNTPNEVKRELGSATSKFYTHLPIVFALLSTIKFVPEFTQI